MIHDVSHPALHALFPVIRQTFRILYKHGIDLVRCIHFNQAILARQGKPYVPLSKKSKNTKGVDDFKWYLEHKVYAFWSEGHAKYASYSAPCSSLMLMLSVLGCMLCIATPLPVALPSAQLS